MLRKFVVHPEASRIFQVQFSWVIQTYLLFRRSQKPVSLWSYSNKMWPFFVGAILSLVSTHCFHHRVPEVFYIKPPDFMWVICGSDLWKIRLRMSDFVTPDFNPGSRWGWAAASAVRHGRSARRIRRVRWPVQSAQNLPPTNPSREMDRTWGTEREVVPL